jgi:DprA winged helix domain
MQAANPLPDPRGASRPGTGSPRGCRLRRCRGSRAERCADHGRLRARGGSRRPCLPGEITSSLSAGTNGLLRLGASPLLAAADVLELLGIDPSPQSAAPEGDPASALARLSEGPAAAAELVRGTGLAAGAVAAALTELEAGSPKKEALYRGSVGVWAVAACANWLDLDSARNVDSDRSRARLGALAEGRGETLAKKLVYLGAIFGGCRRCRSGCECRIRRGVDRELPPRERR